MAPASARAAISPEKAYQTLHEQEPFCDEGANAIFKPGAKPKKKSGSSLSVPAPSNEHLRRSPAKQVLTERSPIH